MYFSSQEPQNIIKYVQSVLDTTAPKYGYDVKSKNINQDDHTRIMTSTGYKLILWHSS